MAESKKHHFVPQFILRNFTEEGRDLLHVFDKKNERSYSSSVNNTGHENNFNTVDVGGDKFNFEEIFADFDGAAAPIVKKLTDAEEQLKLTIEDIYTLSLFVCVQQIRTKLTRTTVQQFASDILEWMNSDGKHFETSLQPITDEQSKIIALGGFNDIEERIKLLLSKAIVLFRAPPDKPIWISDNPVVMHNEYPYGRVGLGTPGTNVYIPISKSLVLGFLCRIDADKVVKACEIKSSLKQPIDPEAKKLYDAIKNDVILELSPKHVDFFNSLQVFYSSRFLYGPSGDFNMVTEMIAESPKLKETLTTLGMGNEKEYPAMPPGEHIVFHLEGDHFMIPVTLNPQEPAEYVAFTTTSRRLILYDFFVQKTNISSIEVFKDRKIIRLMREVVVKSVENANSCIEVKIAHSNEAMNEILRQMKTRKTNS